jgi:general secretion pathway protein D
VKYGEAVKIAQTLQEVAIDAGPKSGGSNPNSPIGFGSIQGQAAIREGIFGGDVSIKADKNTNSLVISASKPDYEKVMTILKKLDIARDQVFVEAIIMEMSLDDGYSSSGGFVQFNKDGGKTGFVANAADLNDVLSPLAGAGNAILGFSQGSVDVANPLAAAGAASTVKVPNLLGFLKFIKQFGKTNILSTPQISALDNQEAEIEVGDSVVIGSQVVPGTNGTQALSQPQFADATIKMTIKPFISPSSDTIRMEFKQLAKQISNVKVPADFQGKAQPLATRSIKTNVIVRNGDTAVIGGLIRDEEIESVKKVPLLGDLPLIGWFFKGKESSKKKVNMLVFLSPKIIRSPDNQKSLLNAKTQERINFIKTQGGQDPFGSTIDKILKREARVPQNVDQPAVKK